MNNPIVNQTYSFTRNLYREYLPDGYWEFQLDLAMELKNRLVTLGLLQRLADLEIEALSLAAILHNVGCIEGQYDEKEVSLTIADSFLREMNYRPEGIDMVLTCIRATQPEVPIKNRLQKMIREVRFGISEMQAMSGLKEVGDVWP